MKNFINFDKCICPWKYQPRPNEVKHFCHSRKFFHAPSQVTHWTQGFICFLYLPFFL